MPTALLISTYEMGRQPFGLASAAAWLRADGWDVAAVDVAKERLRVMLKHSYGPEAGIEEGGQPALAAAAD